MARATEADRIVPPKRHNSKGRSTGKALRKAAPKSGPQECGVKQFGWLPPDLLDSPSWRALSPNTRRLIDRLLLEHAAQGGYENGRLIATHEQLRAYGLTGDAIRPAIEEAVFLGLIGFVQGGRYAGDNRPNRFRLTWMGFWDRNGEIRNPTNEWQKRTKEQIDSWKAKRKRERAAVRGRRAVKRQNRSHP